MPSLATVRLENFNTLININWTSCLKVIFHVKDVLNRIWQLGNMRSDHIHTCGMATSLGSLVYKKNCWKCCAQTDNAKLCHHCLPIVFRRVVVEADASDNWNGTSYVSNQRPDSTTEHFEPLAASHCDVHLGLRTHSLAVYTSIKANDPDDELKKMEYIIK